MLNVELQECGFLLDVTFKYAADYIQRMKKVPGAKFIHASKKWVVPVGAFEEFEELFRGEIVYTTPRHKILGEASPPPPEWYKEIDNKPITNLKLPLMPFQQFGANFLIYRLTNSGFALLCDVMGLGKTPSSIATAVELVNQGKVKSVLVVCLASLKTQWQRDGIQKFTSESSIVIKGTKAKRIKLYQESAQHRFTIINYELLLHDLAEINKLAFDLIIFDEAHKLKSHFGQTNKAAASLKALYKIALTGTPMMNRPDELFGLFQVLNKDLFGKFSSFKKKHIRTSFNGKYEELIGYQGLDELRGQVGFYLLRRTSDEVQVEMPDIIETTRYVPLSSQQQDIQAEIQADMQMASERVQELYKKNAPKEEIEQAEGVLKGSMALMIGCADTLELFTMSRSKSVIKRFGERCRTVHTSPKLEELKEIVEEIIQNGDKIVIFSQFERMVRLIERELSKLTTCVIYHGEMTQEQRDEAIDLFRNDTTVKVFVSTDAGSTGLNLQVANYLIHYDLPWNPATVEQRNGRIRRMDSVHKSVKVIKLIATGSIDETIVRALEKKQNLFNALIENTEAQSRSLIEIMGRKVDGKSGSEDD